jgi:hypothetical protein
MSDRENFFSSMAGSAVKLNPESADAMRYLKSQPERARRAEANVNSLTVANKRLRSTAATQDQKLRELQIQLEDAQLGVVKEDDVNLIPFWKPVLWVGSGALAGALAGFWLGRRSRG